MTRKCNQMGTLGVQGAAWGSHGPANMAPCRFRYQFGPQNVPQMQTMLPKIDSNMHGQYVYCVKMV